METFDGLRAGGTSDNCFLSTRDCNFLKYIYLIFPIHHIIYTDILYFRGKIIQFISHKKDILLKLNNSHSKITGKYDNLTLKVGLNFQTLQRCRSVFISAPGAFAKLPVLTGSTANSSHVFEEKVPVHSSRSTIPSSEWPHKQ